MTARSMRAPHARSNQDGASTVEAAAQGLLDAFVAYHDAFRAITRRARSRFETRDWAAVQADAAERLALYRERVNWCVEALSTQLDGTEIGRHVDRPEGRVWRRGG